MQLAVNQLVAFLLYGLDTVNDTVKVCHRERIALIKGDRALFTKCLFQTSTLKTVQLAVYLLVESLLFVPDTEIGRFGLLQAIIFPIISSMDLKELEHNESMHPFRSARLADRDGDIKKTVVHQFLHLGCSAK